MTEFYDDDCSFERVTRCRFLKLYISVFEKWLSVTAMADGGEQMRSAHERDVSLGTRIKCPISKFCFVFDMTICRKFNSDSHVLRIQSACSVSVVDRQAPMTKCVVRDDFNPPAAADSLLSNALALKHICYHLNNVYTHRWAVLKPCYREKRQTTSSCM